MIRPLRDHIVVKPLDEPLSSVLEVVQFQKKDSRGEIIAVGPSVKVKEERYRPRIAGDAAVGDVIHFTDIFKFPVIIDQGDRRLILQEADVQFIEEPEDVAA